jgi:ribonuclease VapC
MIVDSSALIAILRDEPDGARLARALVEAGGALVSAATYVETAAVVDRLGDPVLSRRLDELLDLAGVEVVAFDAGQAVLARAAYADFGRGSGHPARLNLGDCFSYGLAKATGRPLLFVGQDFSHTDLRPAFQPGSSDPRHPAEG